MNDFAVHSPSTPTRKSGLLFAIVLIFIVVILCIGLVEFAAGRMMTPTLRTGRLILMGQEQEQLVRMQNTIGQSYLLYINAPNYVHPEHGPQNNAEGYRGKAVPMERTPGVLRVLCLGGSTTYGSTVPSPDQAYPARLEALLRADPPAGYTDVEVINAGLTWGTSAEILTHYHFKFHYYQPDIVIINTGGNDANGYTLPYYHPDNSNWRQPMHNLRPLPVEWRWLARSRFASYMMLNIFYKDLISGGQFVATDGRPPATPWFRVNGELVKEPRQMPREQLSFAHNMEVLLHELIKDKVKVLLVPFRPAPGAYEQRGKHFELAQIFRHEKILREFAEKFSTGFAPFPAEVISTGNWTDHCHLNSAGEEEKAKHITPYVLKLIYGLDS